jgi:hypothetical protein
MILLGLNVAAAFPARMLGAYLNSLGRFDLYNMFSGRIERCRSIGGLHVGPVFEGFFNMAFSFSSITSAINFAFTRTPL